MLNKVIDKIFSSDNTRGLKSAEINPLNDYGKFQTKQYSGKIPEFDKHYKNPSPWEIAKNEKVFDNIESKTFKRGEIKDPFKLFGLPDLSIKDRTSLGTLIEYGGRKQLGQSILSRGLDYQNELENGDVSKMPDHKAEFIQLYRARNDHKSKMSSVLVDVDGVFNFAQP